MADFNVNLEAPHASGAKVISPVQSSVQNMPNPWIAFGLGIGESLVKDTEKRRKAEQEAADLAILKEFSTSQGALSDAVAQGAPVAAVGARARANYNMFLANHPQLVEGLTKINKGFFEHANLETVKDAATLAKELHKEQLQTLQKSGSVVDDTTPKNVVDAEWNSHQTNVRVEAEFKKMAERQALMNSMNAEERASTKAKMETDASRLLAEMGDSKIPAMFSMMDHIVAEKEKSTDPKAFELASSKVMQEFSRVEGAINALSQHAPQLAASYKKQFDDIKNFTIERLSGKMTASAVENQLKVFKDTAQLTAMTSDPALKTMYTLSAVVGGQNFTSIFGAQQAQARESYIRLTDKFGGNPHEFFTQPEVDKALAKQVQYQVGRVEKGEIKDREKALGQLGNGANNILKAIAAAPNQQIDPKNMTAAIDFVASPEYAKLRDAGKIDALQASAANKAFGLFYRESVAKGVMEQLDKPFRISTHIKGSDMTYGDLVTFTWDGLGIKPEAAQTPILSLMERGERDLFISKMQNSAKALNHLVNAGANLEGVKPEVYWERNKHNIMPNFYPPEAVKPNSVHEIEGKKFKYTGGTPWKNKKNWIEVGGE